MLGALSRLFGGNKSEKDVKKLNPIVDATNKYFNEYRTLSNDALRAKTTEFKDRIAAHLSDVDAEIADKKASAETMAETEILAKERLFEEIDKLVETRDGKIEEILKEIEAEAFAVVKETARRFTENETLRSTATALDREIAARPNSNVTIEGDEAVHSNHWIAAGNEIRWNMVHYDVQLIGGMVLHSGKIAEMATGEGKTLVSTLPAYLNALAGEGVHICLLYTSPSPRD